MEELCWEFIFNPSLYPPDPNFTKIIKELYCNKHPFNNEFKHLPQSCFKTLMHECNNQLITRDDIKKVVLIVPNEYYTNLFCELWGTTRV